MHYLINKWIELLLSGIDHWWATSPPQKQLRIDLNIEKYAFSGFAKNGYLMKFTIVLEPTNCKFES